MGTTALVSDSAKTSGDLASPEKEEICTVFDALNGSPTAKFVDINCDYPLVGQFITLFKSEESELTMSEIIVNYHGNKIMEIYFLIFQPLKLLQMTRLPPHQAFLTRMATNSCQ